MSEQTSAEITIEASPSAIMAVIADFDSYPKWATAVQSVEVLQMGTGDDAGRADQVRFVLNAGPIKDEYTLAYHWDDDEEVRWELVEGKVLKALEGSYTLRDQGDGNTDVRYQLAVDVTIPMIGVLRRKAEKMIIDTALKELKKQVESTTSE